MRKAFNEAMIVARLIWFRVACYFIIPYATTFLSLTETWSGQTYQETHWFLHVRIHIASALAGIISIVAFIDSAMNKARDEVASKRTVIIPSYTPDPNKDTPTP